MSNYSTLVVGELFNKLAFTLLLLLLLFLLLFPSTSLSPSYPSTSIFYGVRELLEKKKKKGKKKKKKKKSSGKLLQTNEIAFTGESPLNTNSSY